MAKIEKLTPEQEAELHRFRQHYLDIACGGGRIDRDELQSALAEAYAVIGKPPPGCSYSMQPPRHLYAIAPGKPMRLRGRAG